MPAAGAAAARSVAALPNGILLTRRVPGAQLPDTGAAAGPEAVADSEPPPDLDPDAARALVDEFEAGVARALRSVSGDQAPAATTEGDEE
jgi:hypothetical protein